MPVEDEKITSSSLTDDKKWFKLQTTNDADADDADDDDDEYDDHDETSMSSIDRMMPSLPGDAD